MSKSNKSLSFKKIKKIYHEEIQQELPIVEQQIEIQEVLPEPALHIEEAVETKPSVEIVQGNENLIDEFLAAIGAKDLVEVAFKPATPKIDIKPSAFVDEQRLDDFLKNIQEEPITEVKVPAPAQIIEDKPLPSIKPQIDLTKPVVSSKKTKVTIDPNIKALQDRLTIFEKRLSDISMLPGQDPGGGETKLRFLDDIDRSTIGDGKYLNYNDTTKKFQFSTLSGGITQVQSDWTQSDNTEPSFIKNKPTLFSGDYNDLDNLPSLFSGAYADLTGKPTLFSGSYTDLTNKPILFSGSYNDLTDKPTLFSGSYNDLTNTPTIPSLSGYATESYVTTAISNLINGAPDALNTLKEITDQLATDESAVSALTTAVSGKVSLTGSYANPDWITSLAYSKLTGTPTIPTTTSQLTNNSGYVANTEGASLELINIGIATLRANDNIVIQANSVGWTFGQNGRLTFPDSTYQTTAWTGTYSYTDLTNKPTLFSGSYADLTNKPTLFSGSYNDLTDKPSLFSGAASDLTGTTLKSTVVSSSLTSVGTLTNLTVAGSASVTSNSASDKYIDVGTHGQLFDDGNFHIHAKTGNVWINALDSGDINLGYQYNSGSGTTVKVAGNLESKTAYKARTNWNAALNTEITLDNYRYRVTSSGGTYPQVISNISGTTVNSSWVSVATVSGMAITQTGSTGTLLPNNSWTNLFPSHGLDSSGDMLVTTITDKAHGIVHRVTFMRNDDGSTTGYSIFAEKLW